MIRSNVDTAIIVYLGQRNTHLELEQNILLLISPLTKQQTGNRVYRKYLSCFLVDFMMVWSCSDPLFLYSGIRLEDIFSREPVHSCTLNVITAFYIMRTKAKYETC